MSIRIITLGTVQIVHGDEVLTALPAQRLRCAILIYMAVVREAPRDRLLAMFWPERTEERARHALSQNIYELRRVLGETWIEIRGERLVVSSDVSVDLAAFDEASGRSDHAPVLSLYRGPFLEGFFAPSSQAFESWIESQRLRAQRAHRRSRREWIDQLVSQARMRDAVASAREWIALDALDDEGQHRLIELLAESGDRAGALRQFEAYQRLLEAEELEPLSETVQLVERVRAGDVGALPAPPNLGIRPPPLRAPSAATGTAAPIHSGSDEFAAVPAAAPVADPAGEAVARSIARTPARRRRTRAAMVVVLAVLVFAAGLVFFRTPDPPGTAAASGPAPYTLAILYLDDHSSPPGVPHLAAGLTEALIDAFSRTPQQLAVRSKYAVAPFRGRSDVGIDSIAHRLGVDMLLGGGIVASGGVVRVTLQLIDPVTAEVVLSDTIERGEGAVLDLLDGLVDAANWMLRSSLGTALHAARSRGATNAGAWTATQRALVSIQDFGRIPHDGQSGWRDPAAAVRYLAIADSLLELAERLDPAWLEPIVHRARVAEYMANLRQAAGDTVGSREYLQHGIRHADRALRRQPTLSIALEARGILNYRLGLYAAQDVPESRLLIGSAINDLSAATEADPSRAEAYSQLASILFSEARFEDAAAAAARADSLDTFLRGARDNYSILAMSLFELGRDREAAQTCNEGLRRFSHSVHFVQCLLSIMAWSDTEPALPDSAWHLLRSVQSAPPGLQPMLQMLVAATILRAGDRDSALAVLDRAAAAPSASLATGWIEAVIRGRSGIPDQTQIAARLLQDHFARTKTSGLAVRQGRALRPLLSDPAFRAALGPTAIDR